MLGFEVIVVATSLSSDELAFVSVSQHGTSNFLTEHARPHGELHEMMLSELQLGMVSVHQMACVFTGKGFVLERARQGRRDDLDQVQRGDPGKESRRRRWMTH
jgi:hypothetical protein